MPQQQPTQQEQKKQQQQVRIEDEFPHPTMGHGCEIGHWDNKRPLELEDLLPPARACLPGQRDGVSVEG